MPQARRYLSPWTLSAPIVLLLVFAAARTETANREVRISRGSGSFLFVDEKADSKKEMTIYTYLPRHLKASEAPIVFVMHGHHRNAEGYRDDWAQHADRFGFLVLAPLFDPAQWGHYSYSSVLTRSGKIRDKSKWSFSVIEHLFDAVKAATGNASERYYLYGFSEGGQFVHRLVLMLPEARYVRAVIGSPGWYTMPRFDVKFPYGLAGSPVTEASLKSALGRNVVLVLGDHDTDPQDPELRSTPEAAAQGAHRFARGHTFFKEASNRASALKTPFGWRLIRVRGARHDPKQMSGQAAATLMER
jgi:poly(3-hydroxybutyrate) depolymerase